MVKVIIKVRANIQLKRKAKVSYLSSFHDAIICHLASNGKETGYWKW